MAKRVVPVNAWHAGSSSLLGRCGPNPVDCRLKAWDDGMDALTAFGLVAVSAMLVCYSLERRHAGFILGFAFSCALGSAYGFLQGAWPFGVVEAIWAVVAARRWWAER